MTAIHPMAVMLVLLWIPAGIEAVRLYRAHQHAVRVAREIRPQARQAWYALIETQRMVRTATGDHAQPLRHLEWQVDEINQWAQALEAR